MFRHVIRVLPYALVLFLLVSCHPEGCYPASSFGYNTKGVVVSNLVGVYNFGQSQAGTLSSIGYTNHSGYLELRADMTLVCTNLPHVIGIPEPETYLWSTGKWSVVKDGVVWSVEIDDLDFEGMHGFTGPLRLPVIGNTPPHGLELTINHDQGYWVRLKRGSESEKEPWY